MGAASTPTGMTSVAFEFEGVKLLVVSDRPEVSERIPGLLPPGATACPPDEAEESFGLLSAPDGQYVFTRGGDWVSRNVDLEFGLTMLESQIRIYIGIHAPGRIFVHAGVVIVDGRAIVLPGRSFAGKTTLVGAFLRAGASYHSDEYAVLDERGWVHPYTSPLSVRGEGETRTPVRPEQLGVATGDGAEPVGAIVVTSYRPGAGWSPHPLTPGRAALALLHNTVAALERHAEALPVLHRATEGALLLEGDRGEAEPVVEDVLARLAE